MEDDSEILILKCESYKYYSGGGWGEQLYIPVVSQSTFTKYMSEQINELRNKQVMSWMAERMNDGSLAKPWQVGIRLR